MLDKDDLCFPIIGPRSGVQAPDLVWGGCVGGCKGSPLEGTDPHRRHDDNAHKHLWDASEEFTPRLKEIEGGERGGGISNVSANKHYAFEERGNAQTGTEIGFLLWSWEKQKFFKLDFNS